MTLRHARRLSAVVSLCLIFGVVAFDVLGVSNAALGQESVQPALPAAPQITALVLTCPAAISDLHDCSETNARDVMAVPETFSNPAMCAMHAQAYVAGVSIGRDLAPGERVKIVCRGS